MWVVFFLANRISRSAIQVQKKKGLHEPRTVENCAVMRVDRKGYKQMSVFKTCAVTEPNSSAEKSDMKSVMAA